MTPIERATEAPAKSATDFATHGWLELFSARAKRRLSYRHWRVVAWTIQSWGETRYFPEYRGRRWFWPFLRWNSVDCPLSIGYLSFGTNDEAVALCNALSPLSVKPNSFAKETWKPPVEQRSNDDGFATGVVAGVVGLTLLS